MHRFDLFPVDTLVGQYRHLFSTRDGKDVFAHILYDLGVFSQTGNTEEDVILRNYGMRLISILGGDNEPSKNAIDVFMKNIMKQPLKKEK
jgi:hypothetical protein